jgi:hypothetical protein
MDDFREVMQRGDVIEGDLSCQNLESMYDCDQ